MSAFQLTINFTAADLQTIYAAKENIVLIKSVTGEAQFSWLSFAPFESNVVGWDEGQYSIYALMGQGGTVVTSSSEQAAQPSQNYTFDQSGAFSQPTAVPIGQNAYQVTNQCSPGQDLTFGLAQTVTVNGTAIDNAFINSQFIPMGQHAIFRPTTQLFIFLASAVPAGVIIDPATESGVVSQSTTIEFVNGEIAATVTYNGNAGTFTQV
jgi:hypothetical protein